MKRLNLLLEFAGLASIGPLCACLLGVGVLLVRCVLDGVLYTAGL
jgi:hypothetical protein